ncbi:MAG: PQQ-binding-like beta-propeller repeat protein, partial [Nannocystaceae bacterium]
SCNSNSTRGEGGAPEPFPCAVERGFPYPSLPYVGVHASRRNDDFVDCDLAPIAGGGWTQEWHVLQGYGLAQPNTFSPDGRTTYATTSQPTDDACSVWAIDVETGETQWCHPVPGTRSATAEVDEDGNLFLTSIGAITSWDASGNERWSTPLPGDDPERNAVGVHFTHAGHLATVTEAGLVMLLDRATGEVLADFDLPGELGLVSADGLGINLADLLPDAVREDFASIFGEDGGGGLGTFAGASGNFSDNTLAVAPDDTLYIIGGGLDLDHGALVQVRIEGSAQAPVLTAGWLLETTAGSASSPAVSPDGAWVRVSDGNSLTGLLDPGDVAARGHVVDIAACDANTDDDPDPARCVAARMDTLQSGPALGAAPVYGDGETWHWEVQLANLYDHTIPDVVQTLTDGSGLEIYLPGERVWSSVLTLTRDYIVGTATIATPSETEVLGLPLPNTATSEVIVLDRATGEVVFSAPISDDSTSTVTVGPDGSLYVTMLTLLHSFALETRPVGGLIRFAPVR